MKRYITLSFFLVSLFSGMSTSFGQQVLKTSEEAMKQTIFDNESAKDQTYDFHKRVNLTADQIPKIHELFLELDKIKKKLSATTEESERTKLLNDIETMMRNTLKKLLSDEQYETYLKSFRKE